MDTEYPNLLDPRYILLPNALSTLSDIGSWRTEYIRAEIGIIAVREESSGPNYQR